MSKIYQDEEWLREKYWDEELTAKEVAEEANCSKGTVLRWLRNHDIERRSKGNKRIDKAYRDESWLREQYHAEGRLIEDIADGQDVTNATIIRWMKKLGVERRDTGHQQKDGPYKDEDWIRREYVENRKPTRVIADECDVSRRTINYYLEKFGIEKRQGSDAHKAGWEHESEERRQEAREWMKEVLEQHPPDHFETGEHREEVLKKMSEVKLGEKNPRWTGGPVGYYGGTWFQKREEVLVRNDYTCQVCGEHDESNHVHHIKPVREFDDPEDAHFDENLITVCESCHPEVEGLDIEDYQRVT